MAAISGTTTAATSTVSRLFSSTARTTLTKPSVHFRRSSFTPSLSLLPLKTTTPTTFRRHSSTTITSSISAGKKLPEATFSYLDSSNDVQTITTTDLTSSKTTILFAVPGAFTPTCSQKHVPSFIENAAKLKSKGVATIACISVNDAFVMKAWKESVGAIGDDVMFLCDVNGEFTKAIGAELDLSDKPVGLGVRSRRYAMLVQDGVVKVVNMEEGGAFTFSSAQDMLNIL